MRLHGVIWYLLSCHGSDNQNLQNVDGKPRNEIAHALPDEQEWTVEWIPAGPVEWEELGENSEQNPKAEQP